MKIRIPKNRAKLNRHHHYPLFKNAYFLMAGSITGAGSGFVFWLIAARLYSSACILDDLLLRLEDARENSYYLGNSDDHFIPRNLRPDWKIFIDTLILKTEKTLREIG